MAVVKTIGVGGGFSSTPSYTDLVDWEAYLNTSAFLDDEVGRVLWVSAGNELSSAPVTFDGSIPLLKSIYLEAGDASGSALGSFRDHPNKTTNSLRYNPSAGACLVISSGISGLTISDPNFIVRYLQIAKDVAYNTVIDTADSTGTLVDSCIIRTKKAQLGRLTRCTVNNNLFYHVGPDFPASPWINTGAGSIRATNNTLAYTVNSNTSTLTAFIQNYPDAGLHANNAYYGWSGDFGGTGTTVFNTNATSLSTGSSSLAATSTNVFNLASDTFVSVINGSEDFRLASANSSLVGAGSSVTSTVTVDIIGQTRS